MTKIVNVKLNQQQLKIIDESGASYVNIYIPGMFQLMQIDANEQDADYLGDIVRDIKNHKLEVVKFQLAFMRHYDFIVKEGSTWNDYPRPHSLLNSVARRFGRATKVGYLELDDRL